MPQLRFIGALALWSCLYILLIGVSFTGLPIETKVAFIAIVMLCAAPFLMVSELILAWQSRRWVRSLLVLGLSIAAAFVFPVFVFGILRIGRGFFSGLVPDWLAYYFADGFIVALFIVNLYQIFVFSIDSQRVHRG